VKRESRGVSWRSEQRVTFMFSAAFYGLNVSREIELVRILKQRHLQS